MDPFLFSVLFSVASFIRNTKRKPLRTTKALNANRIKLFASLFSFLVFYLLYSLVDDTHGSRNGSISVTFSCVTYEIKVKRAFNLVFATPTKFTAQKIT